MSVLRSARKPVPGINRIDGASHSGMIGGFKGGADNSYFKRVAKALGARKCGWLSAGGSVACWPTANAGTDGGYSWILNMFRPPTDSDGTGGYMPHTNVAVIQHGAEDLLALGSQNLKAYQEALKTEISRYCSSVLHEAESDVLLVSPKPASAVVSSGGSLAAASYFYKIDAYNLNGEVGPDPVETASGAVAANSKITLAWNPSIGATGYRVYRGTAAGQEHTLIADVAAAPFGNGVVSWTDDGTAAGTTQDPKYGITNIPRHWTFGSGVAAGGAAGSNWSLSAGGFKGGQIAAGAANPATQWAQYTTDPDYPGNLVIAFGFGVIPAAVGAGGYMTLGLKIDGVDQPDITISLDKGGHADAQNGKMNGIVLRIGRADCGQHIALGAGVHTIRFSVKDVGPVGSWFIPDYAQIEADPLDGPLIVLPSGFWRLPSYTGKFTVASGWAHGSDAGTDPLNDSAVLALLAAQQAVMAEFPGRCVYVDLDSVLNKGATYFTTDGIHFSNRGHALVAQLVLDAIHGSGRLTSRVASAVGQRTLGPFDGGVWRTIGGVYGTGSNQRPLMNGWVAYSAGNVFPSYMVAGLDGRGRARGWLKQGGAGAATSPMWQNDEGGGPSSAEGQHDILTVAYSGAAWVTAIMRVDTETATTPRQVYAVNNGQIAASSAMILNGMEWPTEA